MKNVSIPKENLSPIKPAKVAEDCGNPTRVEFEANGTHTQGNTHGYS